MFSFLKKWEVYHLLLPHKACFLTVTVQCPTEVLDLALVEDMISSRFIPKNEKKMCKDDTEG